MYTIKEEREIEPKAMAQLVSSTLYERRFGPILFSPLAQVWLTGITQIRTIFHWTHNCWLDCTLQGFSAVHCISRCNWMPQLCKRFRCHRNCARQITRCCGKLMGARFGKSLTCNLPLSCSTNNGNNIGTRRLIRNYFTNFIECRRPWCILWLGCNCTCDVSHYRMSPKKEKNNIW